MVAITVLLGLVVVGLLVWIALERRAWRRSGRPDPWADSGGGTAGILDELLHPTAQHAAELRAVERQLPAPAPLPGDPPTPGA